MGGSDHWLFDDASPVRRPILRTNKRGQVNDANRLNRNSIDHLRNGFRENATADDIVSNLTLGFWAHMTDRSHERNLWIPIIHKAWPKGADRNDVNGRIAGINKIRNRAAHHEHLFAHAGCGCGTLRSCRDAALLFAQLEPIAHSYVYKQSINRCSVDNYLEEHPAPCDVAVWGNHARKTPSESPRFKPPATNSGGNLGVIEGAICGYANQLSHSRNREPRA